MGGENPQKEKARLRKGVSILFATPGRILYHLKNTQSFNYEKLEYLVFEESDRTLDMGFKKELEEIIHFLSQKKKLETLQKVLVSATFGEKIKSLCLKMSSGDLKYIGFDQDEVDLIDSSEEKAKVSGEGEEEELVLKKLRKVKV